MHRIIIFTLCTLFFGHHAFAQEPIKHSQEEVEKITLYHVQLFQDYVKVLLNQSQSITYRKGIGFKGILNLFAKDAIIEVSSKNKRDEVKKIKAEDYFRRLLYIPEKYGYDSTFVEYLPIKLTQVLPDSLVLHKWNVEAEIFQIFKGLKKRDIKYSDFTIKKIEIELIGTRQDFKIIFKNIIVEFTGDIPEELL